VRFVRPARNVMLFGEFSRSLQTDSLSSRRKTNIFRKWAKLACQPPKPPNSMTHKEIDLTESPRSKAYN
jgi:hypothetical protein